MNDYWTLTNSAYQQWRRIVLYAQRWPSDPMFQIEACKAQAAYVMYSAFEQFEINSGNRKAQ